MGGPLSARRGAPYEGIAVPGVTRATAGRRDGQLQDGHELLHVLASREMATKHVERAAEALEREIARDEGRASHQTRGQDTRGQAVHGFNHGTSGSFQNSRHDVGLSYRVRGREQVPSP